MNVTFKVSYGGDCRKKNEQQDCPNPSVKTVGVKQVMLFKKYAKNNCRSLYSKTPNNKNINSQNIRFSHFSLIFLKNCFNTVFKFLIMKTNFPGFYFAFLDFSTF